MNKNVKYPLNYIGGKYKLLPQLIDLFPNKISMCYDIFGGGANVCLNVNSEHIYYNDNNFYIVEILKGIQNNSIDYILNQVDIIIQKYNLSKTNSNGFLKLRKDYNNGQNNWLNLFVLISYSFNYQMRFNNSHKYNSSFGKNRSCFSTTMKNNLISFADKIHNSDIVFESRDFREVDYSDANWNDLVYFDPPYLLSCGVYQDGKRGFNGWSKNDEFDLYNLCDKLDKQTRFAMSNVLESKGNVNEMLNEWSKKYNIHFLNYNYKNSNYQREKNLKDIEILITNF